MESNLSFFEGEHLFPVTKKQIEELNFVERQRKSVVLLQELKSIWKKEEKIKCKLVWSSRGLIQDLWNLLETTVQKILRKELKR